MASYMRVMEYLSDTLKSVNAECYMVGGAVRDIIMGQTPNDYDFVTTASLETMLSVFPKTAPIGLKHGTIGVKFEDVYYDLTTTNGKSLKENMLSRDLTINALAMNVHGEVIDYCGGLNDASNKVARMINPVSAIHADPLRIMRFFRIAYSHGLTMCGESIDTIVSLKSLLSNPDAPNAVSRQRRWRETSRFLNCKTINEPVLKTCQETGVFKEVNLDFTTEHIELIAYLSESAMTSIAVVAPLITSKSVLGHVRELHMLSRKEISALLWLIKVNGRQFDLSECTAIIKSGIPAEWLSDHFLLARVGDVTTTTQNNRILL